MSCIRAGFIANLAKQSFPIDMSSPNYSSWGVGLFVVLRCGRSTMSSFDYSWHAIRVLVVGCMSKSGGLVYVRNRYSELKLVFVLWHIGSSRVPVNVDSHTVVYGEKPRTERTYHLSIRLPHDQWSEDILDGSRMLRRYVRSVRGFSPYVTMWQSELTGGLEESICQRTNTTLSVMYLFLTCTRPLDFDTHHTTKTWITWQLCRIVYVIHTFYLGRNKKRKDRGKNFRPYLFFSYLRVSWVSVWSWRHRCSIDIQDNP
jgi:hypothetical protein